MAGDACTLDPAHAEQMIHSGIAYDDVGAGEPLVFLHGFALDRTMWAPQTSALAARCRCLCIDLRGSGESAVPPPYDMDLYADDVAAILDARGIAQATIIGLSMGGYTSFALWRRHPKRVRALVLADTRAGADSEETLGRRRELIEVARREGSAAVAERQVVGLLGKTTRERHPDIGETVARMMARTSVEGIVGQLEAMMARADSRPTLSTIDVPTLVIVGEEDAVTPPKEARTMHEAIAGSRLEILAHAGHLSSLERPGAFNAVLAEFLTVLAAA